MNRQRTHGEVDLESRLAKRYAAPAFAFMTQVYDATGTAAGRRADAVAMSLYPSRGLHLHGFEIKSYRGDWLTELKNPAKADAVGKFCHYWWIVAGPGVVREDDAFPPTWGLLEPHGDTLRAKRNAPMLEPTPLTMSIMASLFRRFAESVPQLTYDYVPKQEVNTMAEERAKEIAASRHKEPTQEMYDSLRDRVEKFEAALGQEIITRETWNAPEGIGQALRLLLSHDFNRPFRERVRYEMSGLERALDALNAISNAMPKGETA